MLKPIEHCMFQLSTGYIAGYTVADGMPDLFPKECRGLHSIMRGGGGVQRLSLIQCGKVLWICVIEGLTDSVSSLF